MSDDEDYYGDDYEYFEYEEDGYDAVDALAEHTIHSPVLVGNDPDFDFLDYDGDWDESGDDFFEGPTSAYGTTRQSVLGKESPRPRKKQRGLTSEHGTSVLPSVSEPVIWIPLKQRLQPSDPLKRYFEKAEGVALLEDWRERWTEPSSRPGLRPESSVPSLPSQSTARAGRDGPKRKRDMSEGEEMAEGEAVAKSAKSLHAHKRRGRSPETIALGQSKISALEKTTLSQEEQRLSFTKAQHRPGQVLQEVRLPAPLRDGQGNANRPGRPPAKRKATGENEEQPKKKASTAVKPSAATKQTRTSGRQTRSKK